MSPRPVKHSLPYTTHLRFIYADGLMGRATITGNRAMVWRDEIQTAFSPQAFGKLDEVADGEYKQLVIYGEI